MLIRTGRLALCFIAAFVCTGLAAGAETRVALVIGNSAYASVEPLVNPANDAAALADALRRAGFDDVTLELDLDYGELRRSLAAFGRKAAGADIALVYYAGHGIEIGGENYLIPIDATLSNADDVDFEAMPLDTALGALARAGRLKLFILDACRNNPFVRNMARVGATRSIGRGLARVDPASGDTLVAYAAREGTVAADGEGVNSPYAAALIRHISSPSVDVRLMFGRVRDDVLAATNGQQEPFTYGSLGGQQIYLSGTGTPDATGGAPTGDGEIATAGGEAARAWAAAGETRNTKLLEAFIRRYGDSFYADLARARLEELGETEIAVGVFPPTPAPAPEPARRVRPGDEFTDCDLCPIMKVIPPGTFMMGSPKNEKGRKPEEGPQHKVTISRALAVGKFEVTYGEFNAFVRQSGYRTGYSCSTFEDGVTLARTGRSFENPGFQPADRDPVVCVSWQDIQAYVTWLADTTGKPYRLLSEAEWEYAARAGTTYPYSFGYDMKEICKYANISDASDKWPWRIKTCNDGSGQRVTPVGTYLPNGFGLHDMHGNVWEYVADCYTADYAKAPNDGSAVTQPGCNMRMKRSGAWGNPVAATRSAYRQLEGDDAVFDKGFRIGRDLEEAER